MLEVEVVASLPETDAIKEDLHVGSLVEDLGLYLDGVGAPASRYSPRALEEGPNSLLVVPIQLESLGTVPQRAGDERAGVVGEELPEPNHLAASLQHQTHGLPSQKFLELAPLVAL